MGLSAPLTDKPKMLGGEVTWLNPGGIEYEETWYTENLIYSVAGICAGIGIVFIVMTTKVLYDIGFFGGTPEKYLRQLVEGQHRTETQRAAFAEAQEKLLRKMRGFHKAFTRPSTTAWFEPFSPKASTTANTTARL
ncbi:hypothetical protein LQW54_002940 [Pestalotiopsis sp. IQ-011]